MQLNQVQQNAWARVCDSMRENMPQTSYDAWIKPLVPCEIDNERLIIRCDNYLIINHLKARYFTDLFNLVQIHFGRSYELLFHTQEEIEQMSDNQQRQSALNPSYSFENFVVGSSNNLAYVASLSVAEQPGESYNPLFIYGSVGLGKTHLMNAIGNYIIETNPSLRVLMTTSEAFVNELIEAIVQKKNTAQLRNRFRNVDVLIVDDIQFLAKSKSAQEEFFHTFNELYNNKKQIIIASDRPPKDIPTIEDRVRSRFEWGLIADIQKPDYETRVAILRKKADAANMNVGLDVLEYIASRVDSNIRELEGTLTRLNAQCKLLNQPVTLQTAQNSLDGLLKNRETKPISPEDIIQLVAQQYNVTPEDIVSKKRTRQITVPRQIAMYLCREHTVLSTTLIGKSFGDRDHTTVMHACEKISGDMKADFEFRRRISELGQMLKEHN